MKLEGSEERKLWGETVTATLRAMVIGSYIDHDEVQKEAGTAAEIAIAVADRVALAYRERDTSRPR